jgi:hypothetical protein
MQAAAVQAALARQPSDPATKSLRPTGGTAGSSSRSFAWQCLRRIPADPRPQGPQRPTRRRSRRPAPAATMSSRSDRSDRDRGSRRVSLLVRNLPKDIRCGTASFRAAPIGARPPHRPAPPRPAAPRCRPAPRAAVRLGGGRADGRPAGRPPRAPRPIAPPPAAALSRAPRAAGPRTCAPSSSATARSGTSTCPGTITTGEWRPGATAAGRARPEPREEAERPAPGGGLDQQADGCTRTHRRAAHTPRQPPLPRARAQA